jgi:hypothetical protein
MLEMAKILHCSAHLLIGGCGERCRAAIRAEVDTRNFDIPWNEFGSQFHLA